MYVLHAWASDGVSEIDAAFIIYSIKSTQPSHRIVRTLNNLYILKWDASSEACEDLTAVLATCPPQGHAQSVREGGCGPQRSGEYGGGGGEVAPRILTKVSLPAAQIFLARTLSPGRD